MKRYSIVWNYFKEVDAGSSTKCRICGQKQLNPYKNTSNMLVHLKRAHTDLYEDSVKSRIAKHGWKRKKRSAQKDPQLNFPPAADIKEEPEIIFEDVEVVCTNDCSSQCDLYVADTTMDPAQDGPTTAGISYRESERCLRPRYDTSGVSRVKNDDPVSNIASSIDSDLKQLRDRVAFDSDRRFFESVAAELENMAEESKDALKAATWQIIALVKRAGRQNRDLSLSDVFK